MITLSNHGYLPLSSDEEREITGVPIKCHEGNPIFIPELHYIPTTLLYQGFSELRERIPRQNLQLLDKISGILSIFVHCLGWDIAN